MSPRFRQRRLSRRFRRTLPPRHSRSCHPRWSSHRWRQRFFHPSRSVPLPSYCNQQAIAPPNRQALRLDRRVLTFSWYSLSSRPSLAIAIEVGQSITKTYNDHGPNVSSDLVHGRVGDSEHRNTYVGERSAVLPHTQMQPTGLPAMTASQARPANANGSMTSRGRRGSWGTDGAKCAPEPARQIARGAASAKPRIRPPTPGR